MALFILSYVYIVSLNYDVTYMSLKIKCIQEERMSISNVNHNIYFLLYTSTTWPAIVMKIEIFPTELFSIQFYQPFTGKCSYCYLCSLASKYIGSIKEILCIGNPSFIFLSSWFSARKYVVKKTLKSLIGKCRLLFFGRAQSICFSTLIIARYCTNLLP